MAVGLMMAWMLDLLLGWVTVRAATCCLEGNRVRISLGIILNLGRKESSAGLNYSWLGSVNAGSGLESL